MKYPEKPSKRTGILFLSKPKILIHGVIIVCFIIFLVFFSDPVFQSIQSREGEAKLVDISLPAETDNIMYTLETIESQDGLLEINGWAFIEEQNAINNQTYLVFKNSDDTFVFETSPNKRVDVTQAFSQFKLDLDYSGFMTYIPQNRVDQGEYAIGVYIRKGNIEALEYTDRIAQVGANPQNISVKKADVEANLQNINLPSESSNLEYRIESIDITDNKVGIGGWTFIKGQSSEDAVIYLVLRSDEGTYVFDTVPRKRADVTQYFSTNDLDLDNTGFSAVFSQRRIPKMTYTIGLFVQKGETGVLEYTNKNLQIEADLQNITLPSESNNLVYNIESAAIVDNKVTIAGWAFVEGQSAEEAVIYLVLKSNEGTYVFDTVPLKRADVTQYFSTNDLDLDNSGFSAVFSQRRIPEMTYTIGLFIQKGETGALEYTNKNLQIEADLQNTPPP